LALSLEVVDESETVDEMSGRHNMEPHGSNNSNPPDNPENQNGENINAQNDDLRPLSDYATPRTNFIPMGYTTHAIDANNFELKSILISIVQQNTSSRQELK
jgi:hypothetical protein